MWRTVDRTRSPRAGNPARRPMLESLEDRRLLATFTVSNGADNGPGSLRAAIAAANDELTNPGPDAIDFATSVSRVTLTSGPLKFSGDVTIAGPTGGVT